MNTNLESVLGTYFLFQTGMQGKKNNGAIYIRVVVYNFIQNDSLESKTTTGKVAKIYSSSLLLIDF